MSWMPCPRPESGTVPRSNAIKAVIVPRAVDLGGMRVRRALPAKDAQMVGPFIFFDQMGPARFARGKGLDVRPHPHVNLATLTYLVEGEILHRDSLGNRQRITPGAVNWMRAGSGIVHSERSSEERRADEQSLLGIQTWVALPKSDEEAEPRFIHHDADALPLIEDHGVHVRLIAGEAFGSASPLQTASTTVCVDITLEPHAQVPVPDQYVERAVYVIAGDIEIGGCGFSAGQLLILAPEEATVLRAGSDARVMLFGGEPMDGPRYIWWNFVSSRKERIEQAKEDWSGGRFPVIPDDDKEYIPLPDEKTSPRRIRVGSAG